MSYKLHFYNFVYCYSNTNPNTLVLLDAFDKIPSLMFSSKSQKMFIWVSDQFNDKQVQDVKKKIENQLKVFILGKQDLQSLQKQFDSHRTTENVFIICPPHLYKGVSDLNTRYKQIIGIICYSNSTYFSSSQINTFIVRDQLELFNIINQMNQLSPPSKTLPNFLFLTTFDKFSEVSKSQSMSNILYGMICSPIDKMTANLIIDQLERAINIIEQQNKQCMINEKTTKFINQLRNGLSFQQAIKWYTEASIVNKFVNNLLRAALHPTEIFYLQPYFKQLFNSILKIYNQQKRKQKQFFKCYRGGIMGEQQLQKFKDNKNEIVQSLGFLSTSRSFEIAKDFSENVIFQIQIYPTEQDNNNLQFDYGYAQISMYSQFFGEEQILFNPLNYFKILDVNQLMVDNDQSRFVIKLLSLGGSGLNQSEKTSGQKKTREIIKYSINQRKNIKGQGQCFNYNYDLYGYKEYWFKYLQLLPQNPLSFHQKIVKAQTLLKILDYYQFIGCFEQPLSILNKTFQLIFSCNFDDYHFNENWITKISKQQNYQFYLSILQKCLQIFISKGLYSKSFNVIQQYLILTKSLRQPSFSWRIVKHLTDIHIKMEYTSKAPKIYKKYIESYCQILSPTDFPITQILKADKFDLQKNLQRYEQFLTSNFQIFGFDGIQYILMLNKITNIVDQKKSRLDEGVREIIKKSAVIINGQSINASSLILQSFILNLQIEYDQESNKSQLRCKTKQFLRDFSNKFGIFNKHFLKLLRSFARLQGINNVRKQINLLKKSVKMFEDAGQTRNLQYWCHLKDLMKCYIMIGSHGQVYQICRQMLLVQQECGETQSIFYIESLYDFGHISNYMGMSQQSIQIFLKIDRIYQNMITQNQVSNIHYFHSLNALGRAHLLKNDLDKAWPFFQKGWKLSSKLLPQNHPVSIDILHNIGRFYKHKKKFNLASLVFHKCLKIRQGNLSWHHVDCINTYIELFHCYMMRKKYRKSLQAIKKCIFIQQKFSHFNIYCDFSSYRFKASAYQQQGNFKQAIKSYQKCLKKQLEVFKQKNNKVLGCLGSLLILNERGGFYRLSNIIYNELIRSYKQVKGWKSQKDQSFFNFLDQFQQIGFLSGNQPQIAVQKYEALVDQLKLSRLSSKAFDYFRSSLTKLALAYQQLGCINLSIKTLLSQSSRFFYDKMPVSASMEKSREKNYSQLVKFIIQNKVLLVLKAKVRFLLAKIIQSTTLKTHTFFIKPDIYFEGSKYKLGSAKKLKQKFQNIGKKLFEKNKRILFDIQNFRLQKAKKDLLRAKKSLKQSKNVFRKCERLTLTQQIL